MTENGRGAWNNAGLGGTKKYNDPAKAGPYYYLGTGAKPEGRKRTANEYAVYRAVMAYQRALNRKGSKLRIDGYFGEATSAEVKKFQTLTPDVTTPWGGIGPDTSKMLLHDDLVDLVESISRNKLITPAVVSGTIGHESGWDAGAVGYTDKDDLGLAQINGRAHPDMTKIHRLMPLVAFEFVVHLYESALDGLDNNLRDAVAAYNLGQGGARVWIRAGRPDIYTPPGSTTPRNVKAYIDNILKG